ncbi:MAG: hypothetical protein M1822_008183 [Bathelium mastoideum]|nr:MAG: hypothetical protein M1822_008183 [Bathelium mastoideum]
MRAIKIFGHGDARVVKDAPIPELREDYILVKVHSVAINPTDHKHIDRLPIKGATPGCDYAGIVVKVGPKVTKPFKPGDRIFGGVHGSNMLQPNGGSFGEYLVAKGDMQGKIPDGVSFEQACTMGVAIVTIGQSLYRGLGLPLPIDEKGKQRLAGRPVLIYGGSGAMGMMAIQFAKLSGLTVHTTSTPKNFPLLKSLGADATYDYRSKTCSRDIRKQTNNQLHHTFDTISENGSVQICRQALSDAGNNFYAGFPNGHEFGDPNIRTSYSIGFTALGEELQFGRNGPRMGVDINDHEFSKRFIAMSVELLRQGKIKPLKMRVGKGGLKGVLEGLNEMRQGKVSGEKWVYRVGDTA